jgi:hypothetical protein
VINGPGTYTSLPTFAKSVDLKNWNTVLGGSYEYWTVNAGVMTTGQTIGTPVICNPTGIENFNDKDEISIYPNPTSGQFAISLSVQNATITVTDLIGQLIIKKQTDQIITNLKLDKSGVYIVFITTEQGVTSQKLIVNQ